MGSSTSWPASTARGLEKEALLTDVDGSQIQCYRFHGRELVVKNSYYLQELTVDAQEDLEGWFQKKGEG